MDLHRPHKVAPLAACDALPCAVVSPPIVSRLSAAAMAVRPARGVGFAAGSVGVGGVVE